MKPSEFIKQGWCQGMEAIDANGRPARVWSPAARSWCIMGAMLAAFYSEIKDYNWRRYIDFRNDCCKLLNVADDLALADWNDDPSRTKEEVLAVLRQAEKDMGL